MAEKNKTQVIGFSTKRNVFREIQVTHVILDTSDLVVYNRSVQSSVVVFPSSFSFVRKHIGVVRCVGSKSMICNGMPPIRTLLSIFIARLLHKNDQSHVKLSSLRINQRCHGDQAQTDWPFVGGNCI